MGLQRRKRHVGPQLTHSLYIILLVCIHHQLQYTNTVTLSLTNLAPLCDHIVYQS
jgi:hypothetical protein